MVMGLRSSFIFFINKYRIIMINFISYLYGLEILCVGGKSLTDGCPIFIMRLYGISCNAIFTGQVPTAWHFCHSDADYLCSYLYRDIAYNNLVKILILEFILF